jgi:hypothetical protein
VNQMQNYNQFRQTQQNYEKIDGDLDLLKTYQKLIYNNLSNLEK